MAAGGLKIGENKHTMKTIKIGGKDYVMVHERILYFRSEDAYKGWQLETEIIESNEDFITIKAIITNELGQAVSTGHAREYKGDDNVFDFAEMEVCETSAVGRALAFLGIGVEESIASAEEISGKKKHNNEDLPWLTDKDFWKQVDLLNREPDKDKRAQHVKSLKERCRMNNNYKRQFAELVEKRDIQI